MLGLELTYCASFCGIFLGLLHGRCVFFIQVIDPQDNQDADDLDRLVGAREFYIKLVAIDHFFAKTDQAGTP